MNTVVIYDSLGDNTEKVAKAIYDTVLDVMPSSRLVKVEKETEIDLLSCDLTFIGSPVMDWLPSKSMTAFVQRTMKAANDRGLVKPAAPIIPGKFAICFGTYGGPHIGVGEARPMTLWLRSALEHLGIIVLDEWHIPGAFRNRDDLNHNGRLGNIEGRPDSHDLLDVQNRVRGILAALAAFQG
jgi:hypothetical protein